MGKVQKFIIEYDNDSGVYTACQEVRGNVEVQLSEPLEIRRMLSPHF
jgi:hypothetical protein